MDKVKEICEASSLVNLNKIFANLVKDFGFKNYAYVYKDGKQWNDKDFFYVSTYPDKWAEHYVQNKFHEIDPVLKVMDNSSMPFIWSNTWRASEYTKSQKDFFYEAKDFGLAYGVGVPILSNGFGNSTISLVSSENEKETESLFNICHHQMSMYATHFHYTALHLSNRIRKMEKNFYQFQLTNRELDIIKWCAENKTYWEIGIILGISYNTVLFHVKNIFRKMEVQSRQELFVKAVMSGIVTL